MKKYLILIVAVMLSANTMADDCITWTSRDYPVSFETCSYSSGPSGYLKLSNDGDVKADICWTIYFNNGKQDKGCHSSKGIERAESSSCYYCGRSSGVSGIDVTKYEPLE